MTTQNDIQQLSAATVYTSDGSKVGSVGQVYLDNNSGEPEWVSVKTGLFGTKQSFVPLDKASVNGDRIEVPYGKDQIKGAPQIDDDSSLSPAEEEQLYHYYGLSSTGGGQATDTGSRTDTSNTTETSSRTDTSGTRSGDVQQSYQGDDNDRATTSAGTGTDDAMTRSEERLVAGTRTEEAGKARLRKYVVTEQQQVNVPVSHEEVHLEREPITDANRGPATSGPDISESEHEVTLHAERPVVETETVPVERVRLDKNVVTDDEQVGGEVRKEQIDFQDADGRSNR
jgi:uncharacterized protein (TIGR02271 family)